MLRIIASDSPLIVLANWHFVGLLALAISASILCGLATVCLFAFAFQTVNGHEFFGLPWAPTFAVIAASFLVFRSISTLVIAYIGNKAAAEIRVEIAKRVIAAPQDRLEDVGNARLMTTLTADTMALLAVLPRVVQLSTSGATVVALFVYLGWLSLQGLALVLLAIVIGAPLYWILAQHAGRLSYALGATRDRLYRLLEGLILGVKQLRMNGRYGREYLEREMSGTQSEIQKRSLRISMTMLSATNAAQLVLLILLGGLIAFLTSDSFVRTEGRTEFIFGVIYMMSPLEMLIGSFAALREVGTTVRRIQDIGLTPPGGAREPEPPIPADQVASKGHLALQGVTYAYGGTSTFVLGPIDVVMQPGEIIFVTGGNGSGKSTFIKLLTGLYTPCHGRVLLDCESVKDGGRQRYREQFSVIYDDMYLFDRIWNGHLPEVTDAAHRQLRLLGLEHLVNLEGDRFSNTRALSRGQKKRLALVAALLEDRPIYVFDEWAADQDVEWRRYFYRTLLPQMRDRGKLIVAITHDEGYDDVPDRILHLHDGRLACAGTRDA